jgi:[acyl-carrier-protein] S-malonyltransferase
VPVVSNVDATPHQDASHVKDLLVRQVTAPVRWEESVRALEGGGAAFAVEIGPGRVLTGLAKRIAPSLRLANVETPDEARALATAAS